MMLRVSQGLIHSGRRPHSGRKVLASMLALACLAPAGLASEGDEGDGKSKPPAIEIKLTKTEKEAKELNEEIAGLLDLDSEKSATQKTAKAEQIAKSENEGKSKAKAIESTPGGDSKLAPAEPKKADSKRGKPDVSGFVLIELSGPAEKAKPEEKPAGNAGQELGQGRTNIAIKPQGGTEPESKLSVPSLSTPALRELAITLGGEISHGSEGTPSQEGKSSPGESSQKVAESQLVEQEKDPPSEVTAESEKRIDEAQMLERGANEAGGSNEPASLPSDPQSLLPLGEAEKGDGETCPGDPANTKPGERKLPAKPDDLPIEESDREVEIDAPIASDEQHSRSITLSDKVEDAEPKFSQRELAVEKKIDACLDYFRTHPENTTRRGPWALMHTALPFGVETEIIAGNRRVNAIGWMCYNGVCAKQRLFQPTRRGFRLHVGPGVQGHEGQFLAVLAQSQVSPEYPIQIGRSRYTVTDLVKYEMATCREKSELTFKLIGLSHYLSPNQRWRDQRGRTWNLEKMVAEELAQPINGAACGGTHRLMGLSFALIKRQEAGQPLTGNWKRAETFINEFVNYTMTLQNPDGSFSTEWFKGRGYANDTKRKVQTTGHIVEWLIYTLPDEYLRSPQILSAVEYLLSSVGENPSYDWPIGPRGHALRAMALYKERVFTQQSLGVAASKTQVNR